MLIHSKDIIPGLILISTRSNITLTRGVGASYPCPVCLVPKNELPVLSRRAPLRTPGAMRGILNRVREMNATAAEDLLRAYGLRDVEVRVLHSASIIHCIISCTL